MATKYSFNDDVPSKQQQIETMKKVTAKYLKDNPGAKIPSEFKDTIPKENMTNRMNRLISGPDAAQRYRA